MLVDSNRMPRKKRSEEHKAKAYVKLSQDSGLSAFESGRLQYTHVTAKDMGFAKIMREANKGSREGVYLER